MKTNRIIFPVLAAMLAVGAAFATNEKKEEKAKPALVTYFVVNEDDSSYQVTSTPDPDCGAGSQACEISTSAAPDANNRIQKTQASVTAWKN
jgi:hypothetical protein